MIKASALAAAVLAASAGHAATPALGTVFVIALENHNFTQPSAYTDTQALFGNPAAPYLNSLVTPGNTNAAQVSYASNYTNVKPQSAGSPSGAGDVHPSEPNYIWSEAGIAGPRNDADPYPSNVVGAQNLSNLLQMNGKSWKSYQEGTDLVSVNGMLTNTVKAPNEYTVPLSSFSGTSASYTNEYNGSHQYNYAAKHNPQVFFDATNGGNDPSPGNAEASHYAPLEALAGDLASNTVANYNWITPDQYNDMHSGLTGGFTYNGVAYTGDAAKIAQGDNFLSQIIPLIQATDAYKNNGAIVIWNDETEGDEDFGTAGFTSTEIVLSPLAKGNAYTNTIAYDHSSDLRTWQEVFGVGPRQGIGFLGGAAGATDLGDLFQPGAVASVPEPASWALMIAGFGLVGTAARRRPRGVVVAA